MNFAKLNGLSLLTIGSVSTHNGIRVEVACSPPMPAGLAKDANRSMAFLTILNNETSLIEAIFHELLTVFCTQETVVHGTRRADITRKETVHFSKP